MFYDAARHAAIEPLNRWAVELAETRLGPDHAETATALNNLAHLLQATHRLADAEPLLRRVVMIFLKFTRATGHAHPHLRDAIANYRHLLLQQGAGPLRVQRRLREIAADAG